jgi:two-component system CheB/CheR fusion protein
MTSPTGVPVDPETASVQKSHLGFPVVGIGASAGGIGALQRLFRQMPAKTGMAYVVVLHLSPKHESTLDRILQETTAMPVLAVSSPVAIEADHVYVISPSKSLAMSDGYLRVGELERIDGRATAIDTFFRSLAAAHQERAVCIVLSGAGADGTQGAKRIKELGGVTLAQSLHDAEYDSMPRSAIDSGLVDIVLPVAEMPQKLIELWENARQLELPRPPADLDVLPTIVGLHQAEEALVSIKALLRERTGHDFSHYKRATVLRRLERRMQVKSVVDLPAYRRLLEQQAEETPALLQDLLISVTNFFRDRPAFEALERSLLAQPRTPQEPWRAWVAGCATGEEAYSVAMLLQEVAGEAPLTPPQVFASDIDERAIAGARTGLYPESIFTDVPPSRLRAFFFAEAGKGYRIAKSVRDTVVFSTHNVLRDPPFSRVDLICCRNLLIYLDRKAQAQLLQTFQLALKPGGLLFLGGSETTDANDGLFEPIDKKHRIYRCLAVKASAISARASVPMVLLPPAPHAPAPAPQVLSSLHERVLVQHAPPTVLIDRHETVLHVDERAAHLLRVPGGAPSNQLLALVRPELRISLRAALSRAAELCTSVQARTVRLMVNGRTHFVAMSVRPLGDTVAGSLFLVVFDETEATLAVEEDAALDKPDAQLLQLEADLRRAEERLSTSRGESAVSTEELRASNEELQTVNEELRSATEEMETSREELQSVNEELTTVNHELQAKIEESAKAHDDLQNLITSTHLATVFVDRGLHVKRYTAQATTLFNLITTDIGRSLLDITHRLRYEQLAADVDQVHRSLTPMEREVQTNDGRWLLARLLPYRTAEDRIDGVVLTFIDITARRSAEEELRASEQRLRLVTESMQDFAIVTLDTTGVITMWSNGATQTFGHTAAEAVGQHVGLIFTPEDRLSGAPDQEMRSARDAGRGEDERSHLHKDGRLLYCSGVMTPLMVNGKLHGYAKITRDITDNKLNEHGLELAFDAEVATRAGLQQTSQQKDRFLAMVSHELKNPLSTIHMNAQLLQRMPTIDVALIHRASSAIRSAVSSQLRIIDDLLDMSRVNTGKVVLSRRRVEFNKVVESIAISAQVEADRKQQSIELKLGEIEAVDADPTRLEQIVWNLITNAIKFTPAQGHITLATTLEGDFARLDVSDTGIGLRPEDLEHVFEMFRQVENTKFSGSPGLGIGLGLVKELVELHGGRVQASSEGLGKGCTFTVWLPRQSD